MATAQAFFQVETLKNRREVLRFVNIAGTGDLYLSGSDAIGTTLIFTGTLTGARRLIFPLNPADAGVGYWLDPTAVVLGGFTIAVSAYTSLPGVSPATVHAGVDVSTARYRYVVWSGAAFVVWYLQP